MDINLLIDINVEINGDIIFQTSVYDPCLCLYVQVYLDKVFVLLLSQTPEQQPPVLVAHLGKLRQ